MTFSTKTLTTATALVMALSAPAFAETFDVNDARLDLMLDTDGDGQVSNDEIIEGNMMVWDFNGDGAVDAAERGEAEQLVALGGVVELPEGFNATASMGTTMTFDVKDARLDLALDTDGDGNVSDDEIIDGNMMAFDLNGDGAIDANERGQAEQLVANGGVIELGMGSTGFTGSAATEFDVRSARLDLMLDTDGDGDVSDDEIIDGNVIAFDADGDGRLNAEERGVAEQIVENS